MGHCRIARLIDDGTATGYNCIRIVYSLLAKHTIRNGYKVNNLLNGECHCRIDTMNTSFVKSMRNCNKEALDTNEQTKINDDK